MNKNGARNIVDYLGKLFPSWQPTTEIVLVLIDTFAHDWLTPAVGAEVCRQHLQTNRFPSPNVAELTTLVAAARAAHYRAVAMERAKGHPDDQDRNRKSLGGWKAHYASVEGRAEWEGVPPNVRRGLRGFFDTEAKAASGARTGAGQMMK